MSLFSNLFSKALSSQLTVTSGNGFHLRPVAEFSSLAKKFSSQITAHFNNKSVNVKSVTDLLSLSLEKGHTFTLTVKGKEADKALNALNTLFQRLMQEEVDIKPIKKMVHRYESTFLPAEIISKGIAIGSTYTYHVEEIQHKNELDFQEAVKQSIDELDKLYTLHKEKSQNGIYLAQKELLDSLTYKHHTLTAFEAAIEEESKNLTGTILDAKKSDYQDILQRVKKHLGLEIKVTFPETPFILLSDNLLPSDIDQLLHTKVLGVVLQDTSVNSHTAILLRAAGIPALITDITKLSNSENIIFDAHAGGLVLSPSQKDFDYANDLLRQTKEQHALAADKRFQEAHTRNGKNIQVYANVGDISSAHLAKEEGAEGIGLLRSEFLFHSTKPTLEVQTKAYTEIFDTFTDITVRTLDVGGDKALPYISIPLEDNPFLGVRGVRLFRTHPEILKEQLHAIFLAAKNRPIKIMFPMVSAVEEFTQTKSIAKSVAQEYQIDISNILFGIMIEIPSVLFLLEDFNDVVDFYSIGTNDLTQYLFAIERTHLLLKADELSPVVFSAIETIVNKAKKPVSICGELAANTDAIEQLVNLGIETLSVSPKSIAQTKEKIRNV